MHKGAASAELQVCIGELALSGAVLLARTKAHLLAEQLLQGRGAAASAKSCWLQAPQSHALHCPGLSQTSSQPSQSGDAPIPPTTCFEVPMHDVHGMKVGHPPSHVLQAQQHGAQVRPARPAALKLLRLDGACQRPLVSILQACPAERLCLSGARCAHVCTSAPRTWPPQFAKKSYGQQLS
jgi:hypothetical protein